MIDCVYKYSSHSRPYKVGTERSRLWACPRRRASSFQSQSALSLGTIQYIYASPTSGEAYRDRRLTTNFELWVEIFCVPTCFHMRIPKPCLSVHLSAPREKKSPWLRRYQSYITNWYINGKVFMSTTTWKPKNLIYFQKSSKFEFLFLTKSWNHLSFVNISPTLVIDTSMERSSRVLQHGNPNKSNFFLKVRNLILTCAQELISTFK